MFWWALYSLLTTFQVRILEIMGTFWDWNIPDFDLGGGYTYCKLLWCLSPAVGFASWTSYAWSPTVCFCVWGLPFIILFVIFFLVAYSLFGWAVVHFIGTILTLMGIWVLSSLGLLLIKLPSRPQYMLCGGRRHISLR